MDVSKFSPTTYIQAIFVFILGFLIFGEKFFVTDLIGSLLIVSFHIYNWYRPIKSTTDNNKYISHLKIGIFE